jgi:hypothetical protein
MDGTRLVDAMVTFRLAASLPAPARASRQERRVFGCPQPGDMVASW